MVACAIRDDQTEFESAAMDCRFWSLSGGKVEEFEIAAPGRDQGRSDRI
jgi:hypothetical protein